MASTVEHPFSRWFNDIAQLYDDEKLDECIVEGKRLLNDDRCPRYHRIKILLLLGDILPWEEANECWHEADLLWHLVNTWHVKGQNEAEDQLIADLRAPIDSLKVAIEKDPERFRDEDEDDDEDEIEVGDGDGNEDEDQHDQNAKQMERLTLHDVEMQSQPEDKEALIEAESGAGNESDGRMEED